MKAWVLHGQGDIRCGEFEKPTPGDEEVIVRVKAAGICGSDIPRIYKGGAYFYPLIPGHEFAGQVAELGKNTDSRWLNKRVGIFPLIPCRECVPCKNKQFEMCKHYSYLGSRRHGGFAEYVSVPERNLIELPDNVSFEEAAMMEPMAVAVHAIRRIPPLQNDTVVICGLGTIGILILMFLLENGVKNILVIGNKDFQKNTVVRMGIPAGNYCDSKNENVDQWLKEKTNSLGADVFFECVGKNETINQAVNNTAAGGKIMLVGNPYSDISMDKSVYWKILRNQITVTGTWNSSFTEDKNDDWNYVLNKLSDKKIHPAELISHRLDMDSLEKGLLIMRDKSEDYIKIMMRCPTL